MSSNALAVLFVHLCRSIGKDITSTYTKLEKLTLLAKKKTIFDDNRVAVQKLTNVIKQDIAHLNKQIGQLQTIAKYCNNSNTSSNSLIVSGLKERVKGSNRQAIQHSGPTSIQTCNSVQQFQAGAQSYVLQAGT